MKKIVMITKVKNEGDIIESLCRYYAEFCDMILLYENDSIDNTRIIVQELINEGLPIHFVDDIKEDFKKGIAKTPKTPMYQRAFDEFDADIVLNFDADEFLYSADGRNPREILESLDETVEYRVVWRGYVYQNEPEDMETFLPHRFQYYRNSKLDWQKKAIMSRYLYKIRHAIPGISNHFLNYPRKSNNTETGQMDSVDHYYRFEVKNEDVKVEISKQLVLAHYAIRSKAHLMSKIIPNWINILGQPDRESRNFGAKIIYDYIKQYGEVTEEIVRKQSLEYIVLPVGEAEKTISELEGDILIHGPLPTNFCKGDLRSKYTDHKDTEKTWLKELLTQFENALTKLPEREAEAVYLMRETRRYNNELRGLLDSKDEVINNQNEWIKARDDLIKEWDIGLKQRDEVINNQNEWIKARDDLINNQNEELRRLNEIIRQRDDEIKDIYSSRSYKLAQLLRKVFRLVLPARKQ